MNHQPLALTGCPGMSRTIRGGATFLVAAVLCGGCAAHRPVTLADRFVRHDRLEKQAADTARRKEDESNARSERQAAARALAEFIATFRQHVAEEPPAPPTQLPTIERTDTELSAASAALAAKATAANH